MKAKEFTLPVGMSGIMDYSHIECKEYPVPTKEGFTIVVNIKGANNEKIVFDLLVSDNLYECVSGNLGILCAIQSLEACGAFDKQLIYHK